MLADTSGAFGGGSTVEEAQPDQDDDPNAVVEVDQKTQETLKDL
jgi:hypothetical protein